MRASTWIRCATVLVVSAITLSSSIRTPAQSATWLDTYRDAASRLIGESMATTFAWDRLALLGDTFGHRLSGSDSLEKAIAWAAVAMRQDGLENVRTEPVKVPHWVRGRESLDIVEPYRSALAMLGLGNSVGTPPDGIEADVMVVRSLADFDAAGDRVKGKIVLFNVPFTTYGDTVTYRTSGPSRAAARGAVAMLVRAVGPPGLRTPHTGVLTYTEGEPRIPAASIATEDADRLQRMQNRGTKVRLRLKMEAKMLPDADSANVVAEIRGSERPDEVVVVGGHFDSWDVGTGSTDDGGGCVVTWEALRLMKKLNLRPRRTVRVVLFTNEENGLAGGRAYLARYRSQLANHVLMLESDSGVFRPTGFGFTGSMTARAMMQQIATLLKPIGADHIGPSGGGADIGPAVEAGSIPSMSLEVDGNYFLIHHTEADTVDKIDPADMAKAAAAVAIVAYVVADMPERLR
jgi:carboxypeptidase Q